MKIRLPLPSNSASLPAKLLLFRFGAFILAVLAYDDESKEEELGVHDRQAWLSNVFKKQPQRGPTLVMDCGGSNDQTFKRQELE